MAGLATCLANRARCPASPAAPSACFLPPCTWVFQAVQNCSPSWQAAWSAELGECETGLWEAEGLHEFGQFGSDRPAAEEATGKGVLTASSGDKAFTLSISEGC